MIETKDDFVKTFKSARRVSTPLMAVRTPEPGECDPGGAIGPRRRYRHAAASLGHRPWVGGSQ